MIVIIFIKWQRTITQCLVKYHLLRMEALRSPLMVLIKFCSQPSFVEALAITVQKRQDVSVEQTNKTRSTSYKTASYTATNALPYGPQRCRSRKSSTAHAQTCG